MRWSFRPTLLPYTTLFRSLSATSLLVGLALAAAYAHGRLTGAEPLDIASMVRTHAAINVLGFALPGLLAWLELDRKSTRLNSSHLVSSYAVFCLKKKRLTT